MLKTLRILIFILFSSFLVSSQKNEIESDFLNEVIFSDQDSIIYVEKSFGWNKIKKILNRKVFIDYNIQTLPIFNSLKKHTQNSHCFFKIISITAFMQ